MKTILGTLGLPRKILRRIRMHLQRPLFASHGSRFRFDPNGTYSYQNIRVGNGVNLGLMPVMLAQHSEIHIGNNVMFGPRVTVIGGGHNTSVLGRPMTQVHEKSGNEDLGVVIDDDVWVGAGATITRGVTVGRGCVVAAGAVVTKSPPPYSVIAGVPAVVLKFRWTESQILEHERPCYAQDQRYSSEQIKLWQRDGKMMAPKRAADSLTDIGETESGL